MSFSAVILKELLVGLNGVKYNLSLVAGVHAQSLGFQGKTYLYLYMLAVKARMSLHLSEGSPKPFNHSKRRKVDESPNNI